jgi:hypothetical protein
LWFLRKKTSSQRSAEKESSDFFGKMKTSEKFKKEGLKNSFGNKKKRRIL